MTDSHRLTALLLLLALPGCQRSGPALEPQPAARSSQESVLFVGAGEGGIQAERQIARRGSMEVGVDELEPARQHLERVATALAAQVAHSTGSDRWATYALRVPSDRLGALMDSVATLGDVDSRTVTATDVTEQIIDTEARLAALRASRDRLRQLFDRAATVQDVIAVERELARVQGELESLEARLAALKGEVARSELHVRLSQNVVPGPLGAVIIGVASLIGKLFVWR